MNDQQFHFATHSHHHPLMRPWYATHFVVAHSAASSACTAILLECLVRGGADWRYVDAWAAPQKGERSYIECCAVQRHEHNLCNVHSRLPRAHQVAVKSMMTGSPVAFCAAWIRRCHARPLSVGPGSTVSKCAGSSPTAPRCRRAGVLSHCSGCFG